MQSEPPMDTQGRYAALVRPVIMEQRRDGGGSISDGAPMHGQTVLFLLVALLVGAALFTIVPNLSAASYGNGKIAVDRSDQSSGTIADDLNGPEAAISATAGDPTSDVTVRPGAAPVASAAQGGISPVFTREVQFWESKIMEWSVLYDLDPDIIATIMQIESCGDPGAASFAGAQGLFQVMPFHFDPGEDMLDPDTNARRGMAFFNRQLDYTGGNIYLSFAGYNGGYAASGSSYGYWAGETQRYYTWAKGIFEEAKAGLSVSPALKSWLQAGGAGGCQRAARNLGL